MYEATHTRATLATVHWESGQEQIPKVLFLGTSCKAIKLGRRSEIKLALCVQSY